MKAIQLSTEQQIASEHLSGPGLTLAVPGSGKTTLLMMRTMTLIKEHNILPQNISPILQIPSTKLIPFSDISNTYYTIYYLNCLL